MECKYFFKFNNSEDEIKKFKKYIKMHDCRYVTIDLSALNIFDALKYALLSSAYHFQQYPSGKLSYQGTSMDIERLISDFSI